MRPFAFAVLLLSCTSGGGGGGGGDGSDADADTDVDSDADTDCDDADGDGHAAVSCGGDDCDDGAVGVHPGATDSSPEIVVVDDSPDAGRDPSLDLGADGAVHFVYWRDHADGQQSDIWYATNAGGAWRNEPAWGNVNTVSDMTADHAAFDLGPGDRLHAAFDEDDWSLAYMSKGGDGLWGLGPIDFSSELGGESAMVVDDADVFHIAYRGTRRLRYASSATGDWGFEEVDPETWSGAGASIALDPAGAAHIGYVVAEEGAGTLRYATNASGDWSLEDVDPTAAASTQNVALAIDSAGAIHLAYFDLAKESLRHATNDRGAWRTEAIDPDRGWVGETDVTLQVSLAIDPADGLHACWAKDGDVFYATSTGGTWARLRIDSGSSCSIAVDADRVHIAYGGDDVSYATFAPPDGIDGDCDGTPEAGPQPGTSGVDGGRALSSLADADWQSLCEWNVAIQGGPGDADYDCGGAGTITIGVPTVEECVADASDFSGCSATVLQAEACFLSVASDPCGGLAAPECAPLLACAG